MRKLASSKFGGFVWKCIDSIKFGELPHRTMMQLLVKVLNGWRCPYVSFRQLCLTSLRSLWAGGNVLKTPLQTLFKRRMKKRRMCLARKWFACPPSENTSAASRKWPKQRTLMHHASGTPSHSRRWAQVDSCTRSPALSSLRERHTHTLVLPVAGT